MPILFTQLFLTLILTVYRTSESTMPALSSTVLNTSKLPSDTHDGATRQRQHRRCPRRLIHSLRLPDKQRHRRGQRWPVQHPLVGMVLQGPRVPQVLERLVLQFELLAASVPDGCAPRGCTDIHTGRTLRDGEGVESRDGLGNKRTNAAQACSRTEWYCKYYIIHGFPFITIRYIGNGHLKNALEWYNSIMTTSRERTNIRESQLQTATTSSEWCWSSLVLYQLTKRSSMRLIIPLAPYLPYQVTFWILRLDRANSCHPSPVRQCAECSPAPGLSAWRATK